MGSFSLMLQYSGLHSQVHQFHYSWDSDILLGFYTLIVKVQLRYTAASVAGILVKHASQSHGIFGFAVNVKVVYITIIF